MYEIIWYIKNHIKNKINVKIYSTSECLNLYYKRKINMLLKNILITVVKYEDYLHEWMYEIFMCKVWTTHTHTNV